MKADKKIIMNAVSNLGFEVFRNGQFHWNSSNTSDMIINNDGTIHCWTSSPFKNNTSNHGDLIDFLQMININQSYKEAKQEAERLTGLTLPDINKYKDNGYTVDNSNMKTGYISEEFIKTFDTARKDNFSRYKELLNEALPSLDFDKQKEIAIKYQIGYIEQSDRLSMPIRDEENRIITLWKYNKNPNSYINDKGLEVIPGKVLFTKGRERCPFNLYDLQEYRKDINQEIFLCGGEKDTLNMIGNGFRAVTLGAENENLKEKYKPLFQDLKIVISYDNDEAGQKGAEKILKQLQGVAKEIKVWNWKKVEKNQDLTLFKGFDMTDYLSVIKKQNLEFDKTNYQEDIKNEVLKMKKEDLVRTVEVINRNDKELNNISKKLFFFENRMINFKSNKIQKKDIKIELKQEKNNSDFLGQFYKLKSDLSPNIGLDNDNFEQNLKKAEKIETDIGNVKNKSEKVDLKIDNLSSSSLSHTQKDKLFDELEKDIVSLKTAVEKLKEENQNLKKELELLVEKNKVESQKSGLEKENSSLKDKLEALKRKTSNSKNEFESDSKNKITYSQDAKKIQENQNEKER
ncbi:hypothetical protein HOO34_06990 [Aliarcobacter cryaerophilus]|uniref:Toprim domain-containing protein n=1 Tax=Aliarcobacter cryaerophilus TaxID=28198 RepID=A0A7G9LLB8_9BACT|nr:toprim domain-containing protein [Aliarcobacter cryaerophilus]QNM89417.1 hypothetical protein HOO34_06990 [Aliarcobacter cryaerophilus]